MTSTPVAARGRDIVLLLAVVALVLVGAEVATAKLVIPSSRILRSSPAARIRDPSAAASARVPAPALRVSVPSRSKSRARIGSRIH